MAKTKLSFKYGQQEFHFGWHKDKEAIVRWMSQHNTPNISQAAPHLVGSGAGKDVFYWEAEEKVLGRQLPPWDQGSIGSCVGHGAGRAAQDLLLVQIALGQAEGWGGHEVAREPIYAGSRVEVGGGEIRGQDGSTGTWAAEWLNKWGIVLYGPDGIEGTYNIPRCKQWGDNGVPRDIEEKAKEHPIRTVAQVTTAAAARDALANGYPICICGTVSRTMQRENNGFCPQTGNEWPHCQELCGVCVVKGGIPAFVYRNSWGDYLGSKNNQVQLESGRTVTLPAGCYLSDFRSVETDLRQGDTFAYSHAEGWPSQQISWLV